MTLTDYVSRYGISLNDLVDLLFTYRDRLSPDQLQKLASLSPNAGFARVSVPSEPMDPKNMVQKLMTATDILLNEHIDFVSNTSREGVVGSKTAMDVISKATPLANLLHKTYEGMNKASTLRQIEEAMVEAVKQFPETYDRFKQVLKENLEGVK